MLLPNDRVLGGRPPPLCRARRGPRCFTVRSNALLEGSTFSLKALDLKRPIREADMARTLPEGDPRYATDFLPRTDGAGCSPGGGGASGSWWPWPRLCQELRTQELAGGRGSTGRRLGPSSSPSATPLRPPISCKTSDLAMVKMEASPTAAPN